MNESSARREIARLRLNAQAISPHKSSSPAAVVSTLLAVQAQDLGAAKWALGARLSAPTIAQIDEAINARDIVRSWPMRGTLHFVPAEELGWMLSLTTARLLKQASTRHAQLGLDASTIAHARDLASAALENGRSLSRDEFQALLEHHGIATSGGRGYHIIWRLAQTGTLCWGPTDGTTQRLVLLDEWVLHPRPLEHDEALGEFFLRYISGHGPATLADFAWWSKLTIAESKIGLAVARNRLDQRIVGETVYWQTPEQASSIPDAAAQRRFAQSTVLLPAFDEYFLGYSDRHIAAAPEHHERIIPGKNGVFQPIVVAGGRVVGLWKRTIVSGKRIDFSVDCFSPLNATQHTAVHTNATRYAEFLGLTVREIEVRGPSIAPQQV